MATLLLSAIGTVFGGPLGGAIGALAGRQVDQMIFGGRTVSGPRLKELSVQTSSYGSALPLHFGQMRAAGTVIWSTDLVEHQEKTGGGKGRPSVTTYSYTASFAVALSSRPIDRIGRIWADGNLLRGAAGDLKVGGTMRVHTGFGDQGIDPLIAQAEGASACPAHRHCAYVVFEDLELADFGNRLPSLTFEIFADPFGCSVASILGEVLPEAQATDLDIAFAGFAIDQGTVGDSLATISEAIPLSCSSHGTEIVVRAADRAFPASPVLLPRPATAGGDQSSPARVEGWSRKREPLPRVRQCGLRYYDVARDYQPGLQRSIGRAGQGELAIIDLPAALAAEAARNFANGAGRRAARPTDTITYRVTEVDTSLAPGSFVRLPVTDGLWRIDQWEWQKDGVLLDLTACSTAAGTSPTSVIDPGRSNAPSDLLAVPTRLQAFELPWSGIGDGTTPALFVAASAATAGWNGAALFAELSGDEGTLTSLRSTGRARARSGMTQNALAPASALLLDTHSTLDVQLFGSDLTLGDASLAQLLQGANRALVGGEIIQFTSAVALGGGVWRLSGLLRGRGGTEWAIGTHLANEPFVLLDARLTTLDPALIGDADAVAIVAVGRGDVTPATAIFAGAGSTLRPLSPCHGLSTRTAVGGIELTWVRRARGAWNWPDAVDAPLNEESELYEVAYGDATAPLVRWRVQSPALSIPATQVAALPALATTPSFHVRQLGRAQPSPPLAIAFPA
ncbi:MAG: hypothetical protein RIS94_552 [Pseudomonadota bacterium]|jgi:hypothetical protein